MIKRVFDDNYEKYYCTLCSRPMKELHQANEHEKYCGKAVPMFTPKEHKGRPIESDYVSHVAYTRELEEYCDKVEPTSADYAMGFAEGFNEGCRPRPWVGLTDEEYQQILIQHDGAGLLAFYNLVEAKLKEKNT